MPVLDRIRSAIPAEARERLYVIAAAAVTMLASWGVVDAAAVPAWAALAAAVITLGFAILHSTSTVRTALYSLLLAGQGVAQLYGILTETQWASIGGFVAAILGITVAAAKTPTPITADGITAAIGTGVDGGLTIETTETTETIDLEYDDEAPSPGGAAN